MMEGDIIKPRPITVSRLALHSISYWLIIAALFFLLAVPPVATVLPLELVKRFGFAILIGAALIFWLLGSLQRNRLVFPRSFLLAGLGLLGLVATVSAFMAPDLTPALTGVALEVSSVWFFWLILIGTFLVSTFFQSTKQIFRWYGFLFLGFMVIFLFQIFHLFFPFLTEWSHLFGGAANLFGSWADLGVFFGFISLSLFLILELFNFSSWRHGWLGVSIMAGLALLGAAFTGVIFVWWALAAIAFLIFIQSFLSDSVTARHHSRPLVRPSSVLLLLAVIYLLFAYSQNALGNPVADWYQKTNIQLVDVRPTLEATGEIFNQTLKEKQTSFWFGAGPNGFADQWTKYRAISAKPDPLADLEFESGSSFISTAIINTGVVGAAAWFIFFVLLFWSLWFIRRLPLAGPLTKNTLKLIAIGVVYLWAMMWLLVPGSSLTILTFLMTGLLVGYLVGLKYFGTYVFIFRRRVVASSVSVVIIVILLILSLPNFYFLGRNSYAWWYYGRIVEQVQNGQSATVILEQLLSLRKIHHNEVFDRLTVDVANARVIELTKETLPADVLRVGLQSVISIAIEAAGQAINDHQNNYANWLALGSIYETIAPLGIEQATESAEHAYLQAVKFNPTRAKAIISLARLRISSQDLVKAKSTIDQALRTQPFSIPAIIMATQFDLENGEITKAIDRLEQATMAIPNDHRLWFGLGYLRYQVGRYSLATEALRQAIRYNPSLPESHYFLALALGKTGDQSEALKELNLLLMANPNNQNIKNAISDLNKK